MKYPQLKDGEAVRFDPDRVKLYFACCDCGLVHRINVTRHRKTRNLTMRWYREERRTGQRRRRRREAAEAAEEGDHGVGSNCPKRERAAASPV